jgi:predicted NAD/FAD-dependent oxidoreductase
MRGPLTVAESGEHGPVILAGDHCATASIQGAMISGRHAADAAFRRLGVVRPDDRRIAV